jgi:uncharacterized protein YgiM (DUF1202 family)
MKGKLRYRQLLGIAVLLFFVVALGSTAVHTQAADSMWDVKYWNNKTLDGDPVLQRSESNLDHDWGNGSPAPGVVNSDNFSARWKRVVYFPAGSYRFTATTDDGMRVWVDDVLIIDSWWDSQVHSLSNDIYLYGGDHEVKVRYYDAGGQAVAKLYWTAVSGVAPVPVANWKGEYFNNATLSGAPILTRDDASINFDWGGGSPAWGVVASDQFSARWTRTLSLEPGRYRFTVVADDGARLWVNGQLVVDRWHDSLEGTYFVEVDLPGGSAAIQMAYYENVGGAMARLSWQRLGGGSDKWRAEYFNNKNLSGTPVLVRNDNSVNFNWGNGSPASSVNADNFSARWTRSLFFSPGRYRFSITSDDGVRLWVNDRQIINAWRDQNSASVSGEIDLPGGYVPVRLEYYENTGGARLNLSWTQLTAVPQPQPTPTPIPSTATGVVQSPRLNVRYGPGFQYGVITQLTLGQTVTLAGYRSGDGNWVMINWNGNTAWVSGSPVYLSTSVPVSGLPVWQGTVPGTGGPIAAEPTATVAYVYYLNVRTGPGTTYSVIKAAPAGTVVALTGRDAASGWAKVRLADGTVGWMSASYLVKSAPMSSLPIVN